MKILITGSNGQVGQCLVEKSRDSVELLALDRNQLDITDQAAVLETVAQFEPDYIINAAAYTAVDKAEKEIELAYAVNRDGPEYLALAAQKYGAVFLHISTDYVFDGASEHPYEESDVTAPQGIYGKSKLAGEVAVAAQCSRHIIVRTAWVFSEYGNNFVKTMLRLGSERDMVSVVSDQFGGPTYAGDIANTLLAMVSFVERGGTPEWGVYHFSGMPHTSWYKFANEIFMHAKRAQILDKLPSTFAITSSEFPTAAKRPANSRLNCRKIFEQFGIEPSDWLSALDNIENYK
ncbi:dTDP-4-dehydrorhamnose reductase [Vibrio fluvialis]|uniref:dTDP-4-dehydrorhamnose reductase n=1 Tax=Vibrio fluvialis TaxID=676 RepID=UPI0013023750|nr:dTDP-4-dehydrorhamnose reductase [Vibrio fluvialis]EKO3395509.1 dTDP-4-dehydrorhamnose reductase [Vibrio fluvialis]EKO3910276.1 dTDP-4-dehydrorhamnose reductase [Vibrio fluvialis]ELE2167341.1 dTDP-4-dehydrorhamnose reductase [Vibrio fluvialis]ELH4237000.1 dTDP-4-dehydrorhamnose reductase [Vibrio fluvialis]MBY8026904.1 dTDP-4-dehydrorhamnose reductase [Vibrio fluvialis]